MRIGLLVDGDSELGSMRPLLSRLEYATGNIFVRRLKADIQPRAAHIQIATTCLQQLPAFTKKNIDLMIVLIDREDQPACPGEIARSIKQLIVARARPLRIEVVLKDRTYENWLIADPDAFPTRFAPSQAQLRRISGTADHVNGQDFLNACSAGDYNKVRDSQQILARADINRMAANSRSFRRFLRCVGHPSYQDQSKQPS